jgi:hypothetical protein
MYSFKFFEKKTNVYQEYFQQTLVQAIDLISQNQSPVAKKVSEAITNNNVIIKSFFELSEAHYLSMKEDFLENYQIQLPNCYPVQEQTVKIIERHLDGVLYDGNIIYIDSTHSVDLMVATIIHEVSHHINDYLYIQDGKSRSPASASYRDELRSYIAQNIFDRNGFCLLRSDVKNAHDKVIRWYPELSDPFEEKKGLIETGYY